MIKLKQILLEGKAPKIFIPRRMDNRVERMISLYIRNGSKGNLDLSRMNLSVLPSILKNVNVDGYFDCSHNNLTSLENSPKSVNEFFDCGVNKLTTLEGGPKTVNRHYYCNTNQLTSLKGAPETVGGDFYCVNNKLTSLVGAPKIVGGAFWFSYNKLTSLEGVPKVVGKDFYCIGNPGKFTEKDIRAVCNVKGLITIG